MHARSSHLAASALLCLWAMACAEPDATAPTRAPVYTSERFALYNDFRTNLHDYLYWHGMRFPPRDTANACLGTLPDTQQRAWRNAVSFYLAHMSRRHHRTEPLMRTLRYEHAHLDAPPPATNPDTLALVQRLLDAAAPAYKACWWPAHQARNQAWIDALTPKLDAHGDTLAARLSRAYLMPWPGQMPIDIVGYGSWSGANTITDPNHIFMSSTNRGLKDFSALEMVFHETAHTLTGPGYGPVVVALEAAAPADQEIDRSVWHAVLFYTAGYLTQQRLAHEGRPGYTMYMMDGRGVYREHHERLASHWRPYLDGTVSLETAAQNFMRGD